MRHFLLLLSVWATPCYAQEIIPPFNPDANQDSAIGAPDLLEMLPLFGGYFTPAPVMIDGITAESYITQLQTALDSAESDSISVPFIEGNAPGDMLVWDGSHWTLLGGASSGDVLFYGSEGVQWTNLAEAIGTPGCTDPTACNYDPWAFDDNGSCENTIFDEIILSGGDALGPLFFFAADTIPSINFTLDFAGSGGSWAGDMALLISDPEGRCASIGGYDVTFSTCPDTTFSPVDLSWPQDWNTENNGSFNSYIDLSETGLSGNGIWSFTIMNGWFISSNATYSLSIEGLEGFDCNPVTTE